MTNNTIEIPLRITISLSSSETPAKVSPVVTSSSMVGALERVDIDPDYGNRTGYKPNFLGVLVPLPPLTEEQRRNAAKNSMAKAGEDNTVLPYHHFSLVMNRRRQLAYYTAVNIDGDQGRKPQRTGDRWYFDPRIAESEQIGEDLYARNALDRGHLVRRLDPAWGKPQEALFANNDTFHFTNCSPQHANFNQNNETWQGIENYLLNRAQESRKKLTVFTGPVLAEDDPLYRGVRLPVYFWKIAVFVKADGSLSVSAYLLDQKDLLEGLERFDANTFQVTLEELTQRTGLNFSYLGGTQVNLSAVEGLERVDGGMVRKRLSRVSEIAL
ncbi:MAG: DNA/RNA non-specific endonuclease [Nitrospira sp.]|nr:DNA/RNA non-specific endonuclease [Nitrospira sp.]MBX3348970.1 DNA/RNA non-specific endonuclease [Nitrospira sp.]